MVITIAEPIETDAIATLVNGAYRGASALRGWANEAGLLEGQRTDAATLRNAMTAGSTILVMRDSPAHPIAACVSVEPKGTDGTWYLGMLSVDPARQADGLGRRLLEAGERHAHAHGATRIEMTVIQVRDSLIAWYERRGYRLTGQTAPFPYDDERFGRPLRADLSFVILEKALGHGLRPARL